MTFQFEPGWLLPHSSDEGRHVGFIPPITEIILEELIHNLNPAEVCQVVRFLQTTWENSRRGSQSVKPGVSRLPVNEKWTRGGGGVNKAIWPEGPGILQISVSCGEKMKHLPVCNPISWWLSVDIGPLHEWAGCFGCWSLMRNRLRARGHFWDLTTRAKETHQHLDTYCPKSFEGDRNAFLRCTTFHCNIHGGSRIGRPCIFHWLKTTIIPSSLTASTVWGDPRVTESKISLRTGFLHALFSSQRLRDFLQLLRLSEAFLSMTVRKSQFVKRIMGD